MYLNHITKPLPKKYIHSYVVDDDGGICVITCVPYLLKLLDDPGVNSFDDETTYKRVEGKMNEWELSIFVNYVVSLRYLGPSCFFTEFSCFCRARVQ
jgi:hypothetical protein